MRCAARQTLRTPPATDHRYALTASTSACGSGRSRPYRAGTGVGASSLFSGSLRWLGSPSELYGSAWRLLLHDSKQIACTITKTLLLFSQLVNRRDEMTAEQLAKMQAGRQAASEARHAERARLAGDEHAQWEARHQRARNDLLRQRAARMETP